MANLDYNSSGESYDGAGKNTLDRSIDAGKKGKQIASRRKEAVQAGKKTSQGIGKGAKAGKAAATSAKATGKVAVKAGEGLFKALLTAIGPEALAILGAVAAFIIVLVILTTVFPLNTIFIETDELKTVEMEIGEVAERMYNAEVKNARGDIANFVNANYNAHVSAISDMTLEGDQYKINTNTATITVQFTPGFSEGVGRICGYVQATNSAIGMCKNMLGEDDGDYTGKTHKYTKDIPKNIFKGHVDNADSMKMTDEAKKYLDKNSNQDTNAKKSKEKLIEALKKGGMYEFYQYDSDTSHWETVGFKQVDKTHTEYKVVKGKKVAKEVTVKAWEGTIIIPVSTGDLSNYRKDDADKVIASMNKSFAKKKNTKGKKFKLENTINLQSGAVNVSDGQAIYYTLLDQYQTGYNYISPSNTAGLVANWRDLQMSDVSEAAYMGDGGTVVIGTGEFSKPVDFTKAEITSYFGYRMHPVYHVWKGHTGIDIGKATGVPVHSADDGTVELATWYQGYGNCVIVNHGKGLKTLYGHMSRISVYKGQKVKKGQTVGAVGSTGISTGPHLHFEVQKNGTPVNPLSYL